MHHGAGCEVGDHEAHVVAARAAQLGRHARLQARRQGEVEHAHATASRICGATSSGDLRCERSMPGSASACIYVFMSPGSSTKTRTPLPSSSAARMREACASAALLLP